MTTFNSMQAVKRQFFALRNGIIADTIRKAGGKYKIIFGLNLPQITDIAKSIGHNPELAQMLWENNSTRESMLLAPFLVVPQEFTKEQAVRWINEIPTAEVADILCHRLLRHTDYALELASELSSDPRPMVRYTAIRLLFNLLPKSAGTARTICEHEISLQNCETLSIARRLLDELEFFQ